MNRILSDLLIIGTFSIATQSNDSLFLLNRSGNIGVNNSLPSAKFHIKSTGTNNNYAQKIDNQISKPLFYVRDDSNVGIATQSTDRTRLLISQYLDYTTTQRVKGSSIILDSFTVSLTNNVKNTGLEIGIGQNSMSNGGVDDITSSYDKSVIFAYLNDFNALDKNRTLTLFEGKIYSDWINNPELVDSPDLNKIGMDVYIYGNGLLKGQKIVLEANPATDSYFGLPGNNPMVGSDIVMYTNPETSDYAIGQSIDISSDPLSTKNVIGMEVTLTNTATNSFGIYIDALAGASNGDGKAIFVKKGTSIFNYDSNANTDFIINGQSTAGLFYVDASADSIGIGTSSPAYKIEVLGTVSTTAFRMTNGASSSYLMTSDSQGNASWTSSSILGFVTASGTINYLPKWESSNGLSSTSNVYDDGVTVMVGTNSTLDINTNFGYPSLVSYRAATNFGELTYGVLSITEGKKISHSGFGENYGFYAQPTGTARMYGYFANMSDYRNVNTGFYSYIFASSSSNRGFYAQVSEGSSNVGFQAIMPGTTGSNTGVYIDSYGASQSFGMRINRGTSIFNESGDANTDFQIGGDTQPYLFFVDASTDNIGIRNATPSYALHLLGTVSTTGFRMTNGSATNSILRSNGTGDASWVTLSSLNIATGSGTTNYIPRWLSANNLSSTSSIYDNGSSVGIGSTTFTDEKLKIVDTIVSSSRGGLNIELSGNSTDKYGINIDIVGNYSSTNNNYGNRIEVAGSSQNYGIWGLVNGTYGTNYGMRLAVANGTSICYGIQNIITGTSQGKYAVYNSVSGINSQLGSHFGVLNEVSGSNLWNYGVKNVVSGTYGYRQASTNILGSDTQLLLDIANMNYVNTDISKVGSVYAQYNANFASASTRYGTYTEITGGFNSISYGQYYEIKGTNSTSYGIYVNTYNATTNYGIVVNKGTSIFNQEGDPSTDFQIEGDTEQHLFFVDSSQNAIGVNNASPTYKIDVVGTVSTSDFRMTTSTTNYIPRWLSTSHISSTSSLYDDGIDVGIATTSVGRGRLSIVPRGASAAVYISNTTNNSYITYRANTATYSMGVDYDATNPYFAISGGPSSYTTGALGSFDRMRLYNDSMHLIINATSSTVGPASVSNIRKGELVISNFNSISSTHTGKAYTSVILVGGTTTTTISRELKTDGVTASSNKITIPTDTTSAFVVNIQGQSDSNPTTCYFATIRGLVQNYTSSLTILGSTTSVVYNDMSGSASVSVDGTSLQILAQTTTSQIARWVARVEMTTLTQIGEIP